MVIRAKKYIVNFTKSLYIFWTVLLSLLLLYQLRYNHRTIISTAKNEARTHYNRDLAFRLWGASYGGVYVPIDDNTLPNKYLSHIKERDIQTPSGKKLTLMNPAYMVRQMSSHYSALYGVLGHITSLKPIRPENAPDVWERRALLLFEKGAEEVFEVSEVNNTPYLRLMKPIITKESCLKCHGFQNYEVGDVRGGVSISIPMLDYYQQERKENIFHLYSYLLIWFFGLIGIHTGVKGLKRQRHAEHEMRKIEERVYTLEKVSPVGVIYFDQNGDCLNVNEQWCKISGLTKNKALGKGWLNALHYDDREKIAKKFQASIAENEPFKNEFRFLRPDGDISWVFAQALVQRGADGKSSGYVGTVTEINDFKRAQEVLQNVASGVIGTTSEDVFRSIVKYLAIALDVEYALIGRVNNITNTINTISVYGNGTIIDNFEYDIKHTPCEKVLAGETCFFPSGVQDEFPKSHRLVEMNVESYIGTYLADSAGYRIGLIAAFSTHPLEDFETAMTMLRIFSARAASELERINIEEEKQSLWQQFLQSQKMESVGRLAGGIAHDFNNILTGIIGYSELSIKDLDKDHPVQRKIKIIHDGCKRAARLTSQLLAFSRKQVLDMKLNNLNPIINNITKIIPRMIGEDINLVLKTSDEVSNVRVDETQIEQILLNLVVNARSAMPDGGTLTIETKNVEIGHDFAVSHPGAMLGSFVALIVSDTGIGMSKQLQKKIFEPFFTTKDKGEGTGLGLSTVFGIMKQHNGYIWIDSEPDKGAIFSMFFPAVANDIIDEYHDEVILPEGGTETILVVDDDKVILDFAKDMLDPMGYKSIVMHSGEEALEFCSTSSEHIDLLLTDVVMTGINGWELYQEARIIRPEMKVIFTSGYLENPIVLHNIMKYGLPFINKPFEVDIISKKIREVLDAPYNTGIDV
ncbi:ATP-binding protein [Thermodesulfobacteriota bacterium]